MYNFTKSGGNMTSITKNTFRLVHQNKHLPLPPLDQRLPNLRGKKRPKLLNNLWIYNYTAQPNEREDTNMIRNTES